MRSLFSRRSRRAPDRLPPVRRVQVSYQRGLKASWAWVDDAGNTGADFAPVRSRRHELVAAALRAALAVPDDRAIHAVLPGTAFADELSGIVDPPLHYVSLIERVASIEVSPEATADASRALQQFKDRHAEALNPIKLTCDGSYNPSNGVGAWAFSIDGAKPVAGPVPSATSPIDCELTAAVEAFKAVPRSRTVHLRSDNRGVVELSTYILETGTVPVWLAVCFGTTVRAVEPLQGVLTGRRAKVTWVKGHADDELHNLVDEAARAERRAYERLFSAEIAQRTPPPPPRPTRPVPARASR